MMIHHNEIKIQTVANRPSYHDLRDSLNSILKESKILNGTLVVTTPHTTCSFFYEETMHDTNYYDDDYLHVDINNVMEKIVPKMTSEHQYNSPGPKHIEFGLSLSDSDYPPAKWVMLNTDAHLRASIYGTNSQTFIIRDGELLSGSLGRLYFVDWDQLRERNRVVNTLIMGE